MKLPTLAPLFLVFFFVFGIMAPPARADASHARIVRLSLVQGGVRFARDFHNDSLEDVKAVWEVAPLNLPVRQGYAIATDTNGRAEVEFENGAMAFLTGNTTIEFYDLSLDDGAYITRLVLRQGSAIFYVHPAKEDYFSVTGGDFSVEADGRTRFRLDNFDDGSSVNVDQGRIKVLRNKDARPLEKGQSYSINLTNGTNPVIARASDDDDFDKWVSGRIDSVVTATTYSNQYMNSPGYSAGFADLYNYGSFYNIPGYGYGWQPFGVGLGWSPFSYGTWYFDQGFGWDFIGSAQWGWLPFHYGGWVFSPIYGWVWMPGGIGFYGYGYVPIYRPLTAVWVRSGGATGLVPLSPIDKPGKTPMNLAQGIYTLHNNVVSTALAPSGTEKWAVMKSPPRDELTRMSFAATTQPVRVSRTILSSNLGSRAVTVSRDSSIVYDPRQHTFVNNNAPSKANVEEAKPTGVRSNQTNAPAAVKAGVTVATREPNVPPAAVAHSSVVPNRPHISPPLPPAPGGPAHASSTGVWGNAASGAAEASAIGSAHTTGTASSSGGGHGGGGHH